ncbi:MAG: DNA gyrase subunit A [Richelia sp.]|nr:DNA gyrase subunit A [Richelia sp.]
MAKQLNLLSKGQVIPTALHTEMQRSYLEYAMSVIVGRALPDVRDGLKPVHRRILYAMHELGLTPDRPYRKCARVVGDVLGKYHPHGDQAVYDALVRLVQEFSSRYPLLAGHGNFGSVDNDPPAAMRYTETRLASIGNDGMLTEIGEETVDFIGNFDNSQQEPTVLPAQLPFLLLNGCAGIAVGMATNIPPHNLGELIDGLIALIGRPDLAEEKLFELIPGPDFPTGGQIVGRNGIRDAYINGRGTIVMRGVTQIEEIAGSRGSRKRTAIVVTELPYQVNKAGWIEKVADLVNNGKIQGISDIRDESDRQGMRVVIELKRDTHPDSVLQLLYHQTALQTNFGAILLALVDGQPRQLSLRQLLQEFLNFREQTLNRRYGYELDKAQSRLHLVAGLLAALANLDQVITILRQAADGSTAKQNLQNQLNLTESQADAILSMPLRRLTSLEHQNLQDEFAELNQKIADLQTLLSDRKELLKALKKELRTFKHKYNDARRTHISEELTKSKGLGKQKSATGKEIAHQSATNDISQQPPKPTILEFTHRGYVRRYQPSSKKSKSDRSIPDHDFIVQTHITDTAQNVLILTSTGKIYPISVADIPPARGRAARGTPLITLLTNTAQQATENILSHFLLPKNLEEKDLILLTKQGRIKRLPMSEITQISRRGITIIKMKNDDELSFIQFASPETQLTIASSSGRLLRFPINDEQLPTMGRAAMGLQGLRILKHQQMVGCTTLAKNQNILLFTQDGYGKRLTTNDIKLAHRGDLGTQALKFTNKSDNLAGIVTAKLDEGVLIVTNKDRVERLEVSQIPLVNRSSPGESAIALSRDEKIVAVTNTEVTKATHPE